MSINSTRSLQSFEEGIRLCAFLMQQNQEIYLSELGVATQKYVSLNKVMFELMDQLSRLMEASRALQSQSSLMTSLSQVAPIQTLTPTEISSSLGNFFNPLSSSSSSSSNIGSLLPLPVDLHSNPIQLSNSSESVPAAAFSSS